MHPYKVLVADDEIANLNGVVSLLARECPETKVVATFNNGKDIIEYLKNNEVDIAILDIRMPLADGLEVSEYIYRNEIDTSVIIMTGYKEFEYAKRAIDMHVSAFLEKPFNLKQAVAKINEVCSERAKAREQAKAPEETINSAKTARLILERLTLKKQNETEMLNEIISCYTQTQLYEFIPVLLEKIDEIVDIDQAYYINKAREANTSERLFSLVLRIEDYFKEKISSDDYTDHNMRKIEKYIEEHCGEDITLKTVAEEFFYNYSYLSRAFKEKKGESFSAFLLQVRMEKAKRLLKEGELSVIEVAGMVGYSEYANFRKAFKIYAGVSPSQYVELQRMKKFETKK